MGQDGAFYGTTTSGGSDFNGFLGSGNGTVFKLNSNHTVTVQADFNGGTNGFRAYGALVQDAQGNFYGTTLHGVDYVHGTIFKINTNGVLTNLYSFDSRIDKNGSFPIAGLTISTNGLLYGTTRGGGQNNYGMVFRITHDGNFTTLGSFFGPNGSDPWGRLIEGRDGNFYGTTSSGGESNLGTVFRVGNDGGLTTLASFVGTNGANPYGGLLQGSDGQFYGTTEGGGESNRGSIFRMTPDGALTTMASFDGPTNAAGPRAALIEGRDGNFYGTAAGSGNYLYGTIFQVTPTGTLKTLVKFNGGNGIYPYCDLFEGPDGNLYGTTAGGGAYGHGTIFRLGFGMAPKFQSAVKLDGSLSMQWTSVAGQKYQLQSNPDVSSTNWLNVGDLNTATNGTMATVTPIVLQSPGFYRVLLVP
ncbi:MAG: hypothetical protein JWM68_2498 [Verrucomicrobiales bacterium]|nr:hypothetical protein [Verrucomicrobiales bacterium]